MAMPHMQTLMASSVQPAGEPEHIVRNEVRPRGVRQPRREPRVLVVEDDTAIASFVSLALQQEGYAVRMAANGAEAMNAVEDELPDVILLDMLMPVMDGWEFAKRFRERFNHKVPIVVMTAATNAQERAEQIQAEGFLGKPFDLDDLLAAVERRTRHHPH